MRNVWIQEVLEKTCCPVVFLPRNRRLRKWRFNRILLAQDSTAAGAVAPISGFAQENRASLIVLHVENYPPGSFSTEEYALPVPRYIDQPQYELRAWSDEFIERLREMARIPDSVEMDLILARGEPSDEIIHLIAMPRSGGLQSGRCFAERGRAV